MFPKIVVPPNHPLRNRFFHYFHHPFWGTRTFGNTQMMFVQPPCFQHQKGHTVLQPSFPLLSLKKGILLREVKWPSLFSSSPPPKRKACIFHHSEILYIPISPIAPSTSSTIHPKPFFFSVGVESSHFRGGKGDVEELTLDFFVGQVKPLTHVVWLDSLDLSQCGAPKWWRVMEVETFLSFWKFQGGKSFVDVSLSLLLSLLLLLWLLLLLLLLLLGVVVAVAAAVVLVVVLLEELF